MYKFFKLLALTMLVVAAGCAPVTAITPPTATQTTPTNAADPLANTKWRLISFGPKGAEAPVVEGSTLTLEFQTDGKAGGDGGCNSFGSSYQLDGNKIAFGELTTTLRACTDDRVNQQEQQYYQALKTSTEFQVSGDSLIILYDGGRSALNYVQA